MGMAERERLLGILNKPIFPHENVDPLEAVADYLLDNGVTFAADNNVGSKWIPVTERLPDRDGRFLVCKRSFHGVWVDVLCFSKDGRKVDEYDFAEQWQNVWHFYDSGYGHIVCDSVTQWMPLPEPPKEEKMKTEIIKIKGNWEDVVNDCRASVGKGPLGHEPSEEFKKRMMINEHGPIRNIWIKFMWPGIKYWVAMHWKTHIWPAVTNTQRNDRQDDYDRDEAPQKTLVNFYGDANPQQFYPIFQAIADVEAWI